MIMQLLNVLQIVKFVQQSYQPIMQKSVTDKYSSANIILKENNQMGTLLLGDCNSPVDKHNLKPHKVQTIITIGQDAVPQKKDQNINYLFYHILDNKSQKIIQFLDEVYEVIDEGRKKGGVLIHCFTGISRSPSFVIAYLMRKKFINYDQAKAYVKKHRPVAHPNDNFHRQLQSYWKILVKRQQEQRLRREKQQRQKGKETQQLCNNQSSSQLTNTSGLSKKTVRGVKGAVKMAQRSISPQRSIEKKEKSEDKLFSLKTIEQKEERRSVEKANEHVKGIYSAKTKVK